MGRIRTTRQARELRSDVLWVKHQERLTREVVESARLQLQKQAELRHDLKVLARRETMEKFRHLRPTSL